VIDAPPLDEGADQANTTCASPVVPTTEVGAPGVPTNTEDDEDEYAPVPALLTAATLNTYDEPLVKPVTVVVVEDDVPSANVDQLVPELDEY
jgi:hypothetical protein